eukprot:4168894-Amphidinium_carterae.1
MVTESSGVRQHSVKSPRHTKIAMLEALNGKGHKQSETFHHPGKAVADLAREEREAKLRTMFSPGTL